MIFTSVALVFSHDHYVAESHDQLCGRISRPTMWLFLTTNYVAV
ncbi:hypothetical protein COLO4_03794 [Corchorus olitorius]|uniref:Uncharacterized protein n=1 Tax=Corchorus olitorius TaxID=93759 RepID=A0A1R3KWI3_9ROSI|nr:hypothetical protein COLO4_03794 [Corchorus olitorius]